MIKLFSGNRAFVLVLLPVIALVFALTFYFFGNYGNEVVSNFGFWYTSVRIPTSLSLALSVVLILISAVLLNNIFNKHEFLDKNNFLPSLICLVLYFSMPLFYEFGGVNIALVLLLVALNHVFKLRHNEDGRKHAFNSGFFIGLAVCFVPEWIPILLLYLLMIYAIRPFVLRETLLAVLGFITPFLYAFALIYLDVSPSEVKFFKSRILHVEYVNYRLLLLSLLFILSFMGLRKRMMKSSIRLKKLVRIIWLFFLTAVVFTGVHLYLDTYVGNLLILVIPLSFFFSFAFSFNPLRKASAFLLYTIGLLSLISYFLPLLFN